MARHAPGTASPSRDSSDERLRAVPLALAETGLSLILGLVLLGDKSLWNDETYSATVASGSWRSMWESWRHWDANMTLYDVLLRLWRELGTSDAFLRLLSVLFAAGSVYVVFALGRRLFGARAGLIAALLLAVAPFYLQRSQEVRSYTLFVLLVCLAASCFVVAVDQPTRSAPWVGAVVFSALACAAHFMALFVVVAFVASLVVVPRSELPVRRLSASTIGFVVLTAPLGYLVLAGREGQLWWVVRPDLHAVLGQPAHVAGEALLTISFGVLFVVAAVLARRALLSGATWRHRWHLAFVCSWLVLPPEMALVYTFVRSPLYVDRYLLGSLPALVLVAGYAIAQLSRRWATVALATLVVLSGVQIVTWYRAEPRENWRGAVAHVLAHSRTTDGIAFCSVRRPFEYYVVNSDGARPRPLWTRDPWRAGYHESGGSVPTASWPDRVWVVTTDGHHGSSAACFAHELAAYRQLGRSSFDGRIVTELWERR
jgi:mannosyltransferase